MDTALPQKFPYILDRNLAKANCTGNWVCTACDTVVLGLGVYSKTSLNRTLLFQKVVRFSKISVYTKCRIAPANRTKFGLGGVFSDVSDRYSKPSEVRITAGAVECGDASK